MDCLEGMRQLDDNSIDVIMADPPYGINYQSNMRKDKSKRLPKIANDKAPFTAWIAEAYRVLKDGGRVLCFYRWDVQDAFLRAFHSAGFNVRSQIVWDKLSHGMGDLSSQFAPRHENILYATKGRYEFLSKRPHTIYRHMRIPPEQLTHPNEKPITLIIDLLQSISSPGETVLIPFIGSGVDAEACIRTNRQFIGFELSEYYVDIANKRVRPWLEQERLDSCLMEAIV